MVAKSGTTLGELDIYSHTYPGQMYPLVETSDGQERYYITSLTCGYPLGYAVMKSDVSLLVRCDCLQSNH